MAGFSTNWEAEWDRRTNYAEWPWTDLVSKLYRHTEIESGDVVLELGCGAGANIPFFLDLGVEYYSIEGSKTAVNEVRQRFPEIEDTVKVGDFTAEIPFDTSFDYVVDRASLTTNSTTAIKRCLDLVADSLTPDGKAVIIDMYSTDHSEYSAGEKAADEYTRSGFQDGPFANLGEVHFSSQAHLHELWDGLFSIEYLEHKSKTQKIPTDGYQYCAWDIIATPS